MTKACVKTSGTSTTNGASGLFFGFHWSFTILEPSGKGWPLPGTPALYAPIMVELATITLSTSSVRAEETTGQCSYPGMSENAIPLGDASEYLSCAQMAVPLRTLSTPVAIAIATVLVRFMANRFPGVVGEPYLLRDWNATLCAVRTRPSGPATSSSRSCMGSPTIAPSASGQLRAYGSANHV